MNVSASETVGFDDNRLNVGQQFFCNSASEVQRIVIISEILAAQDKYLTVKVLAAVHLVELFLCS
jgi:hypothetical protein